MARAPENKSWYRIAVGHASKPTVLLAAQGEHLGVAIAAAEQHVGSGARALAVEVAPDDSIPLGESVGKNHIVELGASDEAVGFAWPPGVIPQLGQTQPIAGARAGFAEHADPKLYIVEAQVTGDELEDVFLGMIERLPTADNLEVRLLDHFEERAQTDVWLTSRINAKKILAFLDDHDELITNGHVQTSIYIRKHAATLRLTEHKTVVWIADNRDLASEVTKWFGELKVPHVAKLERVTSVPHFHFRGPKSRDRKKLGDELFRWRLRKVDMLKPVSASP